VSTVNRSPSNSNTSVAPSGEISGDNHVPSFVSIEICRAGCRGNDSSAFDPCAAMVAALIRIDPIATTHLIGLRAPTASPRSRGDSGRAAASAA